jgi:hypothetical protein
MGFIDDKGKISDLINQSEVLGSLSKTKGTSSIASVASKSKNLLPFMLDMTNQACQDHYILSTSENHDPKKTRACEVSRIIIEILIKFIPALIKIIKEGIIRAIKASFNCGNDTIIPSPAPSVSVKLENIDLSNTLKFGPDTLMGSLTYGTDSSKDLNLFIYELVQNPGSALQTWKNVLDFTYTNGGDLIVAINSGYVGKNFDVFLRDYMDSLSLFGSNGGSKVDIVGNIMNLVMDSLFGTLSANSDVSVDTLISEEQTKMLMEKIFESDPCELNSQVDDSFFAFSNEDLRDIDQRARARYQGYNGLDMGCGIAKSSIKIDDLISINDDLKNAEPTKINGVIEQSFKTLADLSAVDVGDSDKENVKQGFSTNFIKELPKVFTGVIFTPKIMVLFQTVNKLFRGEKSEVTSSHEFTFQNKVFFEFVARESLAALLEILFEQLKREVIRLISRLATRLISEQADLRLASILSITYGITSGLLSSIQTPDTSEFT